MRTALFPSALLLLLGLGALPACTINYYVPAATDAAVASNEPRRQPPEGRWQQVPRDPRRTYPSQYPPAAPAPQPAPPPGPPRVPAPTMPPTKQPPAPAPTPPVRQNPTPAPAPNPAPAPPTAPAPGPTPVKSLPDGRKRVVPNQTLPADQVAAAPVMSFGRTPCLGKCPHFTARFFADGRVEYEGFRYAPVEGKRTFTIDPAAVQRCLREAEQIGFRQLPDSYSKGASDMPSTTLAITAADGRTKAIRVEEGAPEKLQALFALVEKQLLTGLDVVSDR